MIRPTAVALYVIVICSGSLFVACVPKLEPRGKACPCNESTYKCCREANVCLFKYEICPGDRSDSSSAFGKATDGEGETDSMSDTTFLPDSDTDSATDSVKLDSSSGSDDSDSGDSSIDSDTTTATDTATTRELSTDTPKEFDSNSDTTLDSDSGWDTTEIKKNDPCPVVKTCVMHVDGSTTASLEKQDGQSWATAYRSLQDGIDAASDGRCDVWVAHGTYLPSRKMHFDQLADDERTRAFDLTSGVSVYGSFSPQNTQPCIRNFDTLASTLSGDFLQNDAAVTNSDIDNAYHVVVTQKNTRLDGFVIAGGNAQHSTITNFRMGGGVAAMGATTISNCTFVGNDAYTGGALYSLSGAALTVTDSTFMRNEAQFGGAVANNAGEDTHIFFNSFFDSNKTIYHGNAGYDGGAIYNKEESHSLIVGCVFINNYASRHGGAIRNYYAHTAIINCSAYGNRAINGGALFNEVGPDHAVYVYNTVFWGNEADEALDIYNYNLTQPVISNSIVGHYLQYGGTSKVDTTITVENDLFRLAHKNDLCPAPNSICINGGNNDYLSWASLSETLGEMLNTDISGNSRIEGDSVDIGAYEYHPD
ncbi:MAG: hypothetical protein JXR76_05395 [Deltaproteobacteria bacterium]|nr:hypothetical protein [Deltaproteobacteria bacterium]